MEIRRLFAAGLVFVVGLAGGAPAASAQGASDSGDKQGASTVILKFQKRKVSQDVMDTFYRSLNKMIDQSANMHVVSGGDMTIDDLIVTAGCQKPNKECLSGVSQYIDADRMVFGSIKRSGDAYLFTFRLFDFVEERFVKTVSEQTVEGDKASVKKAIPAIAQAFMYGEVGELKVVAKGVSGDAKVYFDGKKMGLAPTTLKNLPLGQHAVSVRTADGAKKTELVVLRKDKPETVEFDFGGAPDSEGPPDQKRNPPILGYSAAGLGLAGVAVGVVGQIQNSNAVQEEQELMCGEILCNSQDAPRARELQDKIPRTALISTVGYSVGALGLGAGAFLLIRHFTGSSNPAESPKALRSIQIQPTRRGVQIGLQLQY